MPQVMDVRVNNPLLQRMTKRLVADGTTAAQLAAPIEVSGSTFDYAIIDGREGDDTGVVKELGPGQPSPLVDITIKKTSGQTKEYGMAARMAYKVNTNVQPGLDVKAALMATPYERMQLQQEIDFQALAQNTSNMGTTVPAGTAWTSTAADIRGNILDAIAAFPKVARGKYPNTLIVPGPDCWTAMQKNTAFLTYYQYQEGARLVADGLQLNSIEGLRLVIPGRVKNTAAQGQTPSVGFVWPFDSSAVAVVCYIEPAATDLRMGWIRKAVNTAYGPGGELADDWFEHKEKCWYYDYRSDVSFFVQTAEYAVGITGVHS